MIKEPIQRQNDDRIDELEKAIVENLDLIDCPLVHRFTDGMYIREIFMPMGAIVTSMIHKTNHPFTISKGKALVQIDGGEWEEFVAPYTGITQPGTRRVLYILEDCIWTTYHSIDRMKFEFNELGKEEVEKIVEGIIDEIIEPHINYLTGTNIHLDYKNKLNNNKIE
jgi:hypothetical protein